MLPEQLFFIFQNFRFSFCFCESSYFHEKSCTQNAEGDTPCSSTIAIQRHAKVSWRPGQDASLAPACSNLQGLLVANVLH